MQRLDCAEFMRQVLDELGGDVPGDVARRLLELVLRPADRAAQLSAAFRGCADG